MKNVPYLTLCVIEEVFLWIDFWSRQIKKSASRSISATKRRRQQVLSTFQTFTRIVRNLVSWIFLSKFYLLPKLKHFSLYSLLEKFVYNNWSGCTLTWIFVYFKFNQEASFLPPFIALFLRGNCVYNWEGLPCSNIPSLLS